MLERGFDVPREYIPPDIPQTRGRSGNSAFGASRHTASENDLEVGLLQFRCYEAHIPYTMQFFKVNKMQYSIDSCYAWLILSFSIF